MVGSAQDALYVYTRFDVWPTLALLAVPAVVVLISRGRDLFRALPVREPAEVAAALRPLVLVLVPAALLVAKGALDVRFHLLYGPLLLVYCAAALAAWPLLVERGRPALFWTTGLLTWAYVFWTLSTAPHTAPTTTQVAWMVVGAALAVPAFVRSPKPRPMVRLALVPLAVFVLWATFTLGPLDWGRRWRGEPSRSRRTCRVRWGRSPTWTSNSCGARSPGRASGRPGPTWSARSAGIRAIGRRCWRWGRRCFVAGRTTCG